MEVSEYLVGSPAFKAGGTGDPRTAGSIPVHLRHRIAGFAAGLLLVLLAVPSAASASARLLSSTPADGASLASLDVIEFDFDTLLLDDGAMIAVTRSNGAPITITAATIDGTTLRANPTDSVAPGNYSISYSVQSADGSRNVGSINVTVDAPDQAFDGGLLVVIAIASALGAVLFFAFRADRH